MMTDLLQATFERYAEGSVIDSGNLASALLEAGVQDVGAARATLAVLDPHGGGAVTLEQFISLVRAPSARPVVDDTSGHEGAPSRPAPSSDGPDPRVDEFLRMLEDYRITCEQKGDYEEAAKCTEQLATIRAAEVDRRIRAMKARHVGEREETVTAHAAQFAEFSAAWERYLAEYDAMAAMYVAQMHERHGARLREFQGGLHEEVMRKPVKSGREVLDWRAREQMLVKQRLYAEAARVKAAADELERLEREKLDNERLTAFASKEAKFRATQNAELAALLKRIEARRLEHTKQWEGDSRRLAQRNRNVQTTIEARHASEEAKTIAEIKIQLQAPRVKSLGTAGTKSKLLGASTTGSRSPPKGGLSSPGLAASLASTAVDPSELLKSSVSARQAPALSYGPGATVAGLGAGGHMRSPGGARQLVARQLVGVAASGGKLEAPTPSGRGRK